MTIPPVGVYVTVSFPKRGRREYVGVGVWDHPGYEVGVSLKVALGANEVDRMLGADLVEVVVQELEVDVFDVVDVLDVVGVDEGDDDDDVEVEVEVQVELELEVVTALVLDLGGMLFPPVSPFGLLISTSGTELPPSLGKTTMVAVVPLGTVTTQKFAPPAPGPFICEISLTLCSLGSI